MRILKISFLEILLFLQTQSWGDDFYFFIYLFLQRKWYLTQIQKVL